MADADDNLLDFMLDCNPVTLKTFVSADPNRWQVYHRYSDLIWQTLIQRDFPELFDLLHIDPTPVMTGSDEETYMKCLNAVLMQLAWATSSILDDRLPTKDVVAAIKVLLQLDHTLLAKQKSKYFVRIAAFTFRHQPQLLEPIVRIFPNEFYRKQEEIDTDFTAVIIDDLQYMKDVAKSRAVPFLYKLFIEPYDLNPAGYLNKYYSDYTKMKLQAILL